MHAVDTIQFNKCVSSLNSTDVGDHN